MAAAQRGLLRVGVWCIGEYCDLLARAWPALEATTAVNGSGGGAQSCPARTPVPPSQAVDLLQALMVHHDATAATRRY
jgi:hypothetical protein